MLMIIVKKSMVVLMILIMIDVMMTLIWERLISYRNSLKNFPLMGIRSHDVWEGVAKRDIFLGLAVFDNVS